MFIKHGGVYTIVDTNRIKTASEWSDVVKKSVAENIVINKNLEPTNEQKVVCQIDPENYIYIHTTIMASVDLEKDSDYWITRDTEKYINTNGDAWPRPELLNDFNTFVEAGTVYVEHDQNPERAKGKVLDAVARDMGDTVLVDLLFCVDKRHTDLVHNIETGLANAVSMGCTTKYTICSICGNIAHDEKEYCDHVKNRKNQMVKCADGQYRKACELCFKNTFYDCSIVSNPAFAGAVFRRLVASDKVSCQLLSNILCKKIDSAQYQDEIMKLASAGHPLEKDRGTATYVPEDAMADIPYRDPHNTSKIFDEQQDESVLNAGPKGKKKIAQSEDFGSLVILRDRYHIPSKDRPVKVAFNFLSKGTVGRLVGKESNTCAIYFSKFGMIRNIPIDIVKKTSIEELKENQEKGNILDKTAKIIENDLIVMRKGTYEPTLDRFVILRIEDDDVEVRWLDGRRMGEKEVLSKRLLTGDNVKWASSRDLVSFDADWDGNIYQLKQANWNEKYAKILDQFESHIDNVQHDITTIMPQTSNKKYSKSFKIMTKFANATLNFRTTVDKDNIHINVESTTW